VAGRGTTATAALERAKIPFTLHEYAHDPRHESYGAEASEALGVSTDRVFKTLVAEVDGALVTGVVPVEGQLDLKALAAACGGKKAAMAQVAAAERATGYVAGGISPVGQRKRLPVVLDSSALRAAGARDRAGARRLGVRRGCDGGGYQPVLRGDAFEGVGLDEAEQVARDPAHLDLLGALGDAVAAVVPVDVLERPVP
jgi:Cys-tRNA(Pro)/Cys-tRNA(Cys) deacylase